MARKTLFERNFAEIAKYYCDNDTYWKNTCWAWESTRNSVKDRKMK